MGRSSRMVVLANSVKCGGYCLAGKTLDSAGFVGGWVRPVTGAVEDGLPLAKTLCADGRPAAVLDVVSKEFGASAPSLHQTENRLVGEGALKRCGRVSWEDLAVLADDMTGQLWIDGFSSSCGINDRVPGQYLAGLDGSLKLLAARDLLLYSGIGYEGQIKRRAEFSIGQRRYNLALTDSVAAFGLAPGACREWAEAYICVSLAVPFRDGNAYKLATSIITKERAWGGR